MTRPVIMLVCLMLMATALRGQEKSTAGPAETRVYYKASNKIFPCKWRKKRINPEYTVLITEEIPRIEKLLDTALHKYPARLLKKNLKRIYVLRTLRFFHLDFGGTYYRRNVYITDNGIGMGYTDIFIEGTFHHEFSSILLDRHFSGILQKQWQMANPQDFSYGKGGVDALHNKKTGLRLDPMLFEDGFLNEYSMASFEEDWNCYAEYIFLNDPNFWDAWEVSERIREKTAILIAFYHTLDPMFTLDYFRSL